MTPFQDRAMRVKLGIVSISCKVKISRICSRFSWVYNTCLFFIPPEAKNFFSSHPHLTLLPLGVASMQILHALMHSKRKKILFPVLTSAKVERILFLFTKQMRCETSGALKKTHVCTKDFLQDTLTRQIIFTTIFLNEIGTHYLLVLQPS